MAEASSWADLADPGVTLPAARLVQLSGLDADGATKAGQALREASAARRLQIAERLVQLAEDDATLDFAAVYSTLLNDDDPAVRRAAVDGLWESDDRTLIAPFTRLVLSDADLEVRRAAALALGRFVVLAEFDQLRPGDVATVLGALREVADDPAQPPAVRARAVEAVGASSEDWVRELIWRAYDAEDRTLQLAALHAMGRNSDPEWLPTLYVELESDDPARRYEAATAAGQIADEDAIPYLAELIEDEDSEVQEAAVQALGEIGGDLAVEALREHAGGGTPALAEAIQAAIAAAQAAEGIFEAGPVLDLGDESEQEDDA